MVAVIMTIHPMPALARHQMAEEPAIIALAIIMTTHPIPALARHQTAKVSETIAMRPHLEGHQNTSEFQPYPWNPLHQEGNSTSGNGHRHISKNLAQEYDGDHQIHCKINEWMPRITVFEFKMNGEAAESNCHILWRFNFDLGRALEVQAKSLMGYGSEFRKGEVLLPPLQHHPLWTQMMNMLAHGLQWPTKPITKQDRAADLIEVLIFGNHKDASTQQELLLKLVSGNVKYGYALPLPLRKIRRIPGVCMVHLNSQTHWAINERRVIIEKDRLTHNQSFE